MSFSDAIRRIRDGGEDSNPPADPPDVAVGGEPATEPPLSVTEVCRRVNKALLLIEGGPEIRVEGEIGSCSLPGHWYFTLKDEEGSQLSCAFFSPRYRADSETPTPQVGMKVVAHGRPELYAKGGRLSFIASRLREAGLGDLHQRFERLKADLRDRGWFEPTLRLELPDFARRIMVITSGDGAARRDVEETARRLWPGLELLLIPVPVQGPAATPKIARAVRLARASAAAMRVDAIILTRGGGSLEDLWCFNEEAVAAAIFESRAEAVAAHLAGGPPPVPLVAAIGHESDSSIAEFVADHRASTPTQAAMVLVPDAAEQGDYLNSRQERLRLLAQRGVERARGRIEVAARHEILRRPARMLDPHRRRLDDAGNGLIASMVRAMEVRRAHLAGLESRLGAVAPARSVAEASHRIEVAGGRLARGIEALIKRRITRIDHLAGQLRIVGPDSVLSRGYALVLDEAGKPIRDAGAMAVEDRIRATFARGSVVARVETVDPGEKVESNP
ncbi:MAG: exodeoxyribonuclease VII large subunit [Phycisphaerae bacterium]|nr:exodeoxyribonuclease VII large subunit [Phycisphaerae bacterium]